MSGFGLMTINIKQVTMDAETANSLFALVLAHDIVEGKQPDGSFRAMAIRERVLTYLKRQISDAAVHMCHVAIANCWSQTSGDGAAREAL